MALPITKEAITFAELDPHEGDVLFIFDPLLPSGFVKKVIRAISDNGRTISFTDGTTIDVSTILARFHELLPALRTKVIFDYKTKGKTYEGVGVVVDHALQEGVPMIQVAYLHSWVWDDKGHCDARTNWIERKHVKDTV